MRTIVALLSGISGLLLLMAVMGGFQPRLQTAVIGVILLLIAYVVPKLGRRGGGAPTTDPAVKEKCPGSWQVGIGSDGASMRNCPQCHQLRLATPAGVMLEHDREQPHAKREQGQGAGQTTTNVKKRCPGSGTLGADPRSTGASAPWLICKPAACPGLPMRMVICLITTRKLLLFRSSDGKRTTARALDMCAISSTCPP
jgi:hypothetical protein